MSQTPALSPAVFSSVMGCTAPNGFDGSHKVEAPSDPSAPTSPESDGPLPELEPDPEPLLDPELLLEPDSVTLPSLAPPSSTFGRSGNPAMLVQATASRGNVITRRENGNGLRAQNSPLSDNPPTPGPTLGTTSIPVAAGF